MDEDPDVSARVVDCLDEGYIPIGFVLSIKALNPDGDLVLVHRVSAGISAWEAVGMGQSIVDDLRDTLRSPQDPGD